MRRWMLLLSFALAACGAKGPDAGGEKKVDFDADPIVLLPGSAVALATVDAHALFASESVGAQLATITRKIVPLADAAGFQAQRDVDRITLAGYATGGIDIAAVLTGRFDEAKIAATTTADNGTQIVRGMYAGRTTYTAGPVAYAVLTSKTLVAGTGEMLRRLLERLQTGTLDRSISPWMVETLRTPGADVAAAADFENPTMAAAISSVNLNWLQELHVARVIGNFAPPGMNVAATLTYGDSQQAQAAVAGVHFVDGWLKMLGPLLGGVRLQNLEATTDAKDLRCKFAVDDKTLRTLLALASRLIPTSP